MKRCGRCKKSKPLTEFYRESKSKDGHGGRCKRCVAEAKRAWIAAHPERVQELERARNAYKREHERNHRAACPRCGEPMRAGSGCESKRPGHCDSCRRALDAERIAERDRELVALWAAGKTLREIAKHFDWSMGHLGQEMNRARSRGADLPYRRAPRDPASDRRFAGRAV